MRHTIPLIAGLLLATTTLASGQNLLREFETIIEDITAPILPQRQAPRAAPAAAPEADEEAAETPPIPRARPEGLGENDEDAEVEAEPPEAEETEAEPETVEPDEDAADEVVEDEPAEAEPEPEPVAEVESEPARIYQQACPAVLQGRVVATMQPPIAETQCGTVSPYLVTAVMANGREIALSNPATMNCSMATGLADWAESIAGNIEATTDSTLASFETSTSYFCRPRNGVAGADTSEHGFANALDVTALVLEDGTRIGVLEDWDDDVLGQTLRYTHGAACNIFTTVLGPEANALHENHFHFDLGCHGSQCRSRLCE
jgi:hypothetical protein